MSQDGGRRGEGGILRRGRGSLFSHFQAIFYMFSKSLNQKPVYFFFSFVFNFVVLLSSPFYSDKFQFYRRVERVAQWKHMYVDRTTHCSTLLYPQNDFRMTPLSGLFLKGQGISAVRFGLSAHFTQDAQASRVSDFCSRNLALSSVAALLLLWTVEVKNAFWKSRPFFYSKFQNVSSNLGMSQAINDSDVTFKKKIKSNSPTKTLVLQFSKWAHWTAILDY